MPDILINGAPHHFFNQVFCLNKLPLQGPLLMLQLPAFRLQALLFRFFPAKRLRAFQSMRVFLFPQPVVLF